MENRRSNTDFTIKIADKEIHVHRQVVSEKSDYFKAMLSHDTREKQSGIVDMKDVEFEAVKTCIDSIYGGQIVVCMENSKPLLHAARLMQLTRVCKRINQFYESILDIESFFEVQEIAVTYGLDRLVDKCHRIALENLSLLAQKTEFYGVDKNFLLGVLLSKKSAHPRCEDSKLAIILNWVNTDFENRNSELVELLTAVNLSEVSKRYLKYIMQNEKSASESLVFMDKLKTLISSYPDISPERAEICFIPAPNALLYLDVISKSFKAYYPSRNSCITFSPVFPFRTCKPIRVVATEDFMSSYVICFWKNFYHVNLCEGCPKWVRLEDTMQPHDRFSGIALHGDHIYLSGEYNTERYTISENKWSMLANGRYYRPVDLKALAGWKFKDFHWIGWSGLLLKYLL